MGDARSGRGRFAALVAAVVVLVVFVVWRSNRPARQDGATDNAATGDAATTANRASDEARPRGVRSMSDAASGVPVGLQTIRDRALRDEFRRQIFAAWRTGATATNAPPNPPVDPLHAPMPEHDGGVDPQYLRERIHEDFLPMASICYDQFLTRRPGVAGRTVMSFTIVGDPHVGGVVDEASIESGDGGLAEPEFETCMRESMMAMAFRPPPGSGTLHVTYPFRLSPDRPDGSPANDP